MAAGQAPDRTLLLGTEAVSAAGVPTITGVTTGTSRAVDRSAHGIVSFFVRGIGAVGAGTVIIEEADIAPIENGDYTGTWSTMQTVTVPANGQASYHPSDSAYGFIRARIGTTVTVGTATVVMRSRGAM